MSKRKLPMNKHIYPTGVLGLDKVGCRVDKLLDTSGLKVTGDALCPPHGESCPTMQMGVEKLTLIGGVTKGCDCSISYLQYNFNLKVATIAHQEGSHCFNLTEDVPTVKITTKTSKTARAIIASQCGLAPASIAIAGAWLVAVLDTIRSIKLRIGKLVLGGVRQGLFSKSKPIATNDSAYHQ